MTSRPAAATLSRMNGLPLHSLRVLYLAGAVGVLLVTGVMFAVRERPEVPSTLAPALGYAAGGLLLASIAAVQVLRGRALAALQADTVHRAAVPLIMVPLALLETPALLAAVALFLGGPTWLLALPALAAAALVWATPSNGSLLNALNA
ncbi:MAG: hypothetical protein FJ086_19700 [Deltaproteobacteria bacterium]|nr:hypothetical protein [Deltaproteobacteria bacterium]